MKKGLKLIFIGVTLGFFAFSSIVLAESKAEKAKKIMKEVLLYTENRIFAYYNENNNSTTEGRK